MNDNKQPTNLNNTEVVNNDKREMKVEITIIHLSAS